MEIYVVLVEGVYLQNVCGVFDDLALAIKNLYEEKKKEPDNYHDFFIVSGGLNKPLDLDNEIFRLGHKAVLEPISQEFIDKLLAGK